MKGMGSRLLGDTARFPFEQRIFNLVMLLGICMTLFGALMDVYYGASSVWIDFIFLGCWLVTYHLSKVTSYFQIVSFVSIGVFVFAFIPYLWMSSGGIKSVLPYYGVVFIVIVSIVLQGKFRIVMVSSIIAVELLLIAYDGFNSGTFIITDQRNLVDMAVHLSVILVSMAVLIIAYSNIYMKEKKRNEQYAKTIEANYHQQSYYMENLEQLIYKLKSERHDFNNHLGVIYGLLEAGDTNEAKNYATQLVNQAAEYQNIINVPYTMLRAMLNYKLSAARENGIELRLLVDLPADLSLDEFDLTVILGNLLDNAMEACATLTGGAAYIDLLIQYKPDYLIIQIANPLGLTIERENGKIKSTKPDGGDHGFGLRNIAYIVEKHNGFIKLEPQSGVFKVNIALLVNLQQP